MNNLISGTESRLESSFFNKFILQVYSFMTVGLFITAATAFGVLFLSNYSTSLKSIFVLSLPFIFIAELVVVLVLSFFWQKFNGFLALGLFIFYALLNGVFFGILMQVYTLESIAVAFGATFLTFGAMSLFGYFTKSDLTRWRSLAYMALFGLIIGTVINIIISFISPGLSNGLYWILTYLGLAIFLVLVAVDTQKLKQIANAAENNGGGTLNYATQGALILYLDFINIFIRILAITGKRR